jgi:hypothetical protein
MNRQTTVLVCKPKELYLALAHIENKLARAWLHKFDGGKKIPIDSIAMLCPITTMDMRRTTAPYSRNRLGPEISLLQGLKAFPTSLIAPSASKMLLVRSPGLQNYPC